ncbi:MAG: ABC transporter ATP-binding protein, partial [Gammaproteobacteria bacterium]
MARIAGFFEMCTAPFPNHRIASPPRNLVSFCLHHSRGMMLPLVLMAVITALIAVLEVSLFSFLGDLVDWLSTQEPETFFSEQWLALMGMASVLLLLLPILTVLHTMLMHQSLLGNYPMAIRWSLHRYLLHQSVSFYHNEFAGRVATKVMQTALSVRELVMKLLDIFVYVSVYFISMLALVWRQDWRLS